MTKIINVRKKRRKRKLSNVLFDIFLYTFLILVAAVTLVPFLQVLTISMSPQSVVAKSGLHLIPTKFDFSGYEKVFHYPLVWTAYLNTIIRAALGTGLSVLLYIIGAYPLSKKYLPHKKAWTLFVIFTMYFSGGLIPTYLVVNRLHLIDTVWAMVIPNAVSVFNIIITRTYFINSIPDELLEAAQLDGANTAQYLFKVVLPLSKPILAVITLFYAVGHWNDFYSALIYINSQQLLPLQSILRKLLLSTQMTLQITSSMSPDEIMRKTQLAQTLKYSSIIVSTVPVLCLYPLVQKHFVKGIMIGSVKG